MKIVFAALSYDTHDGAAFAVRKVVKDDDDITTKPKHTMEPSNRILKDASCLLLRDRIERWHIYVL